jgi:hypothetical protein
MDKVFSFFSKAAKFFNECKPFLSSGSMLCVIWCVRNGNNFYGMIHGFFSLYWMGSYIAYRLNSMNKQ